MDKMLQWTLWLGQNVTVDVVNLDVTSRQPMKGLVHKKTWIWKCSCRKDDLYMKGRIHERLLGYYKNNSIMRKEKDQVRIERKIIHRKGGKVDFCFWIWGAKNKHIFRLISFVSLLFWFMQKSGLFWLSLWSFVSEKYPFFTYTVFSFVASNVESATPLKNVKRVFQRNSAIGVKIVRPSWNDRFF